MADDPTPRATSGEQFGFLVRKIGPLPVWAWGVIAVGIYYWYTHYGPGASSAASSAAPPGGSGNTDAVTETLNTSTGPTTSSGSSSGTVNPVPVTVPPPKPAVPDNPPVRQVKPPNHNPPRQSEPPRTVTVAKWPGKSSGGRAQWNTTLSGIAAHERVPLGDLEKDNPQVRNPNLIYPGEKINIPDAHQEHVYHEEAISGK